MMGSVWRSTKVVILLGAVLMLTACTGDVMSTDEYTALEAQLEDTTDELEASMVDADRLSDELEQAQSDLDAAMADLEGAEADRETALADLQEWQDRATAAEDAIEADRNKPWPDIAKGFFIEGCASERDPNISLEEQTAACSCMADSLEGSVDFGDFMMFSVSALDPSVELDPITGLPVDLDEEFQDAFVDAIVSCLF